MTKLIIASLLFLILTVGNSFGEECKDTNEWCRYHTRYGACNYNEFTKTVCKKSCGLCDNPTSNDVLIEDLSDESECKDTNEWCHYHIRYGACHFNEFTKTACKKSCGLCNNPTSNDVLVNLSNESRDVNLSDETDCKDTNDWCHYLTRYGACNFNDYTKEVCKKSCNLCKS